MFRSSMGALLLLALGLTGCIDCETEAVNAQDAGMIGGPDADTSRPLGIEVGDRLANLSFVRPDGTTQRTYDYMLSGGGRVLLLTTAAGWCSSCIEEQPVLQAMFEESEAAGLRIMVALFEETDGTPAEAAYAERWKTERDLTFDVVADPEFVLDAYYNSDATPLVMVVNLPSMEILYKQTGFDKTVVERIIGANL